MTLKSSKIDMLPTEIITHLRSLQLPREAFEYIDRCILPSTTPNGVKSYTVRYPCTITGEVLVLSSKDIEFAQVITFLADPQVSYYIPQPAVLELDIENPRARFYPPDFLVFYKDKRRPVLLETKPSTHLAERAARHPERFTCVGPEGFAMPLAAAAAAKLGFDFRVICERHFDETFLRNALFLEPYRKWSISPPASAEEKQSIKDQVAAEPGIKIIDVKHECTSRRADLIHHMLATGEVFAHLSLERLSEPNRVALFPSAIRERALALFEQKNPPSPGTVCPYVLHDGLEFTMKGKVYTIAKCSDDIEVRNPRGDISIFPIDKFINLLPSITAFHGARLTKEETLKSLSDDKLAVVLRRFSLIQPWVAPSEPSQSLAATTDRTIQRYSAAYWEEEARSGNGLLGLIPRTDDRGCTDSVYPAVTMAIMHRVIVRVYLRPHPRPTMKEAYYHFVRLAVRLKLGKTPSYKTFIRAVSPLHVPPIWGELGWAAQASRHPNSCPLYVASVADRIQAQGGV